MQKRSVREWVFRSVILIAGLAVAHLGVTLFLLSDLGSDPFNVLIQGIFRQLNGLLHWQFLTHGRTHMAVSVLIIVILLLTARSYVKIGTLICMLLGGPIIDIFTWLFGLFLPDELSLFVRILMLVLGCVILAYGMTIAIKSDAGTGPNDLVAVVISDKLHWKFWIVRLLVDALFAGLGFLLGGTVGAGTLVCIALVGPVAGIFLPINEKMVRRILKGVTAAHDD